MDDRTVVIELDEPAILISDTKISAASDLLPLLEALLLLFTTDVQHELEHSDAVLGQHLFERVDLFVARPPD